MFLWGWMPYEGRNETFKMMLKQELKKFPLIGALDLLPVCASPRLRR
jgi:hypothetical protein